MNMREQFEKFCLGRADRFHPDFSRRGLHPDAEYQVPGMQNDWEVWQGARFPATACPGHGRSECVSCCWPKDDEQAPVQTCQIGIYGKAYDGPGVTRAYTYRHQPDNVGASKLGQACCHASKKPGGYFIDQGLGLLMYLENAGFGVFEVQP